MSRHEYSETRPESSDLPIFAFKKEIQESIAQNPTTLIIGEPGCGKTTQAPLMILDALGPDRKIAVTQPRRVAVRSVATYTAKRLGVPMGTEVGYQVRFEDRTSAGSRLNFLTDGILLRKLQGDPLLREYDAVMVDEAHERGLNIDFTLGLLKEAQQQRQRQGETPLKIIVSSATLEKDKFTQYFQGATAIEVPGRTYPVKVHYASETPKTVDEIINLASATAAGILKRAPRVGNDILIFMPGVQEIEQTIKALKQSQLGDCEIIPLHRQLSPQDQDRIFTKSTKPRIIAATNIAETSLTIEGIRHVIDSGLIKETVFDPRSGIESLVARKHAKSGCIQRAGRAGRMGPGECWRLYTESDYQQREEFPTPEIMRSNLAHVILLMKDAGVRDLSSFSFIDTPPLPAIKHATERLQILGAIDANGKLTRTGELMAQLPIEPHLSRMIVEAEQYDCTEPVATICAMMTDRPIMSVGMSSSIESFEAYRKIRVPGSDFLTLLNVWRAYDRNGYSSRWAYNNYLDSQSLEEARRTRTQLLDILKSNLILITQSHDYEAIAKSIAAGLVENLLVRENNTYTRVKDNRRFIYIHPSSMVVDDYMPRFLVTAQVTSTTRTFASTCQEFKPEWIQEFAQHLVDKYPLSANYDPDADIVSGQVSYRIPGSSKAIAQFKETIGGSKAAWAFAEYLEANKTLYPFGEHNKAVLEEADKLWMKLGNPKVRQYGSSFNLTAFYARKLGAITNKANLDRALENGDVNLFLQLDHIVPPHIQDRINSQNPDQIVIGDESFPVTYHKDAQEFFVTVHIPLSAVFRTSAIPAIQHGKPVRVEVVDENGNLVNVFKKPDIKAIRRSLSNEFIDRQWSAWQRDYSQKTQRFPFSGNVDNISTLPEAVPYGIDPQSGEKLLAYPAFKLSHKEDGSYELQLAYYNSIDDAEWQQNVTKANIADIQQMKEARGNN